MDNYNEGGELLERINTMLSKVNSVQDITINTKLKSKENSSKTRLIGKLKLK